jgi:hypothetical protein
MIARAEFTPRRFHLVGQRLEVHIGAAAIAAGLPQWRSVKQA